MKAILTFTVFFYCLVSPAQHFSMDEIRNCYQKAPEDKGVCKKLISILDNSNDPILMGYRGSATMIMAEHVPNPFSKLSYFRKGKKILERAIAADDENLELRFLRFAMQTKSPAMLGYRGDISKDKKLIINNLSKSEDLSLKIMIKDFLVSSESLNEEEKQYLLTHS